MFELSTYDKAELERRQQAERLAQLQENDQRQPAGLEPFTLTGSSRPADLPGQGHLF
jgi:hypothetical protein